MNNYRIPGPIEELIMREIDELDDFEYIATVHDSYCKRVSRHNFIGCKLRHGNKYLHPIYVYGTPQYLAEHLFDKYQDKINNAIQRASESGNERQYEFFNIHMKDYIILSNIIRDRYNLLREVANAEKFVKDLKILNRVIFNRDDCTDITPRIMVAFIDYYERVDKSKETPLSKKIGKKLCEYKTNEELWNSLTGIGLSEATARLFHVRNIDIDRLSSIKHYLALKKKMIKIEESRNKKAQKEFYTIVNAMINDSNRAYFYDDNESCPFLPHPEVRRDFIKIDLNTEDRKKIISLIDHMIDTWYKKHPFMSNELRILINTTGIDRLKNGYLGMYAHPGDYLQYMDLYWVTATCDIFITSIRTLDRRIYPDLKGFNQINTSTNPETYDIYLKRLQRIRNLYNEGAQNKISPFDNN